MDDDSVEINFLIIPTYKFLPKSPFTTIKPKSVEKQYNVINILYAIPLWFFCLRQDSFFWYICKWIFNSKTLLLANRLFR